MAAPLPSAQAAPPGGRGRAWSAFAVAAISCIAVGALLGVLWARLAPRVDLLVAGDGKAYPQGYQPEGYMAADGIAALLCIVAGIVVGVLAVIVLRRRTPQDSDHAARWATIVVIPLGLLGAVALWFVGTRLGGFDLSLVVSGSAQGAEIAAPLRLRMPGVLVLWPAASLLVVFVVAVADWIVGRRDH